MAQARRLADGVFLFGFFTQLTGLVAYFIGAPNTSSHLLLMGIGAMIVGLYLLLRQLSQSN